MPWQYLRAIYGARYRYAINLRDLKDEDDDDDGDGRARKGKLLAVRAINLATARRDSLSDDVQGT